MRIGLLAAVLLLSLLLISCSGAASAEGEPGSETASLFIQEETTVDPLSETETEPPVTDDLSEEREKRARERQEIEETLSALDTEIRDAENAFLEKDSEIERAWQEFNATMEYYEYIDGNQQMMYEMREEQEAKMKPLEEERDRLLSRLEDLYNQRTQLRTQLEALADPEQET